jgi:hypothetical protein
MAEVNVVDVEQAIQAAPKADIVGASTVDEKSAAAVEDQPKASGDKTVPAAAVTGVLNQFRSMPLDVQLAAGKLGLLFFIFIFGVLGAAMPWHVIEQPCHGDDTYAQGFFLGSFSVYAAQDCETFGTVAYSADGNPDADERERQAAGICNADIIVGYEALAEKFNGSEKESAKLQVEKAESWISFCEKPAPARVLYYIAFVLNTFCLAPIAALQFLALKYSENARVARIAGLSKLADKRKAWSIVVTALLIMANLLLFIACCIFGMPARANLDAVVGDVGADAGSGLGFAVVTLCLGLIAASVSVFEIRKA